MSAENKTNDFEPMDLEDDDLNDIDWENLDGLEEPESLFWGLKIPANKTVELEPPQLPNYLIRMTKACFGPKVQKQSRTVIMCNQSDDPEKPEFSACDFDFR